MEGVKNILFVMCDQLRWDYLSCYGHPTLATPNIDGLARRGVRFDRAYVQSPVCGPSRMSYYTGRYVSSHRAYWNFVPLPIGELTIGDYLRPHGMRVALAGKTHMVPDAAGMQRLGVVKGSDQAVLLEECGFEPFDRDDGIHPGLFGSRVETPYCEYLRGKGYEGDNPWHDYANSAEGPNGEILSGWKMRNAALPARINEEDSETPYMVDRAIEFIREQGEQPWFLHLSLIKPHWPYIVPAPYNAMYGKQDVKPVVRSEAEREVPHPVYAAFMKHEESVSFSRDVVRDTVIPTYMGLVKQIDDCLGRLIAFLRETGREDDTMIVFTSDHGDYLGDHWLGEKELFHDAASRVPLIIVDPRRSADPTRGTSQQRLVEAIDLLPTFLDAVGVETPTHIVEGRSLQPLLHGMLDQPWRDAVFSEFDYSFRSRTRALLGRDLDGCRCFMAFDGRWKYIHYDGFRPQLFDLSNDPGELVDLGDDAAHASVRERMHERLFDWLRHRTLRQATPRQMVERWTDMSEKGGILLGDW
ncbi:alkaline phosphatase family protein [Burkholderia anthina]|uniref:alkaline phosphatase family protein n=1 Tax=Burkholderia anthina TaxID=179879 RepID=UPI001588B766|nr:alkaline phosphatase family protein [Burkholderia anthina]